MMIRGPSIVNQSVDEGEDPPKSDSLSIAQLIVFNSIEYSELGKTYGRRDIEKETPLSIYVALKVYSVSRSEQLVDCLHKLGLCVSYQRVDCLSTNLQIIL